MHGRARGGDEKRSRGCPLFIRVHYTLLRKAKWFFIRAVRRDFNAKIVTVCEKKLRVRKTYVRSNAYTENRERCSKCSVCKFQQICRIAFKRIHIVSKQKENPYRVDKIIYYTERVIIIIINNLRRHYNIVTR